MHNSVTLRIRRGSNSIRIGRFMLPNLFCFPRTGEIALSSLSYYLLFSSGIGSSTKPKASTTEEEEFYRGVRLPHENSIAR